MQVSETVQCRDWQLLKEVNTPAAGEMSLPIQGVRVGNDLPALTEEEGKSDLGRKVRQPRGGEGAETESLDTAEEK